MIVTLAGPGAGKTTDLIEQIENVLSEVDTNREIAVITYTNASVNDLKDKLIKKQKLPQKLFIGTIHSFLFRYYIQPFAQERGYKTSETTIVDRFSDAGVDWIEGWVKQKVDISRRNQTIKAMKQSRRNCQIEAAAKKGIYTFDGIIKIAKLLSEDRQISKAISNRLQYLFVDEYQDIDKYGHSIIMQLYKQKKTNISIVGDPDQSIYRFRYGNSQIGEQAPQNGKQPLNEFVELCKKNSEDKLRELTINHRSSKEIVKFNNRYSTLTEQIPEKGSICQVQILDSTDKGYIIDRLFDVGNHYECKSYLILAKDNTTVCELESVKGTNKEDNLFYDLNHIIDVFIADTGLSKIKFQEEYKIDRFQLRRIAVAARNALQKNEIEHEEVAMFCKNEFKDLYSIDVNLNNAQTVDNNGKKLDYGYESEIGIVQKLNDFNCKYISIHKSKGLESDAVLVVAKTESEMLKWLNMTRTNMKSDSDEMYRLGYVAFTRPRKILMLACLEKMDFNKIKSTVNVQIVK